MQTGKVGLMEWELRIKLLYSPFLSFLLSCHLTVSSIPVYEGGGCSWTKHAQGLAVGMWECPADEPAEGKTHPASYEYKEKAAAP